MKLLCFIDNLGPGGAQRQLCRLALHFKGAGMDVEVLTYHEGGFFSDRLAAAGIACRTTGGAGGLARAARVRSCFVAARPDVVLAFLPMPCLYAEMAGLLGRRWGLVVSERSSVSGRSAQRRFRLMMHRLADCVTANSHTNRALVESAMPALTGRVVTLYNALNTARFSPGERTANGDAASLRLVAAANYRRVKNAHGLADALSIVAKEHGAPVRVDWHGDSLDGGDHDATLFDDLKDYVRRLGLEDTLILHGLTANIVEEYRRADAVILPSFVEGLPNSVCEGMACGLPVLASAVSDIPRIVGDGWNGLLFDPNDCRDIARAIGSFRDLSASQRLAMGRRGREAAELMFDEDVAIDRWLGVLERAATRRRPVADHWIPADAAAGSGLRDRLAAAARPGDGEVGRPR